MWSINLPQTHNSRVNNQLLFHRRGPFGQGVVRLSTSWISSKVSSLLRENAWCSQFNLQYTNNIDLKWWRADDSAFLVTSIQFCSHREPCVVSWVPFTVNEQSPEFTPWACGHILSQWTQAFLRCHNCWHRDDLIIPNLLDNNSGSLNRFSRAVFHQPFHSSVNLRHPLSPSTMTRIMMVSHRSYFVHLFKIGK